jgi:hypothetical protein
MVAMADRHVVSRFGRLHNPVIIFRPDIAAIGSISQRRSYRQGAKRGRAALGCNIFASAQVQKLLLCIAAPLLQTFAIKMRH